MKISQTPENQSLKNQPPQPKSLITYEQLKSHADYSDAWIAINGVVYDITDYIDNHPFGDTFRGSLGTDCSGLFSSAHLHTNVGELIKSESFLAKNKIRVVGELMLETDDLHTDGDAKYLDRIVYQDLTQDEFWNDLKARINDYLNETGESTHYSTTTGILYLIYHTSLFILLSYFTWMTGSFPAAILLGFHMVCASASMAHMSAHFGLTSNPVINSLSRGFMDLSGFSSLEWQIVHQTHHSQPHSSIDYQTNQYSPVRIHEYVKHRPYHRYQYLYFWMLILLYQVMAFPMSTIWMVQNRGLVRHFREAIAHLFAKGILIALIAYCGYAQGVAQAGLVFVVYSISFSLSAFLLLYNNHEETHHILTKKENINPLHQKLSWAEVQVKTSGNWVPGNWFLAFIEFHYGYFNYHIEHHLFPSFKPSLLKKVSPIVRQTCQDHGIPYISTTFGEVQQSFQEHLTKLGQPEKT